MIAIFVNWGLNKTVMKMLQYGRKRRKEKETKQKSKPKEQKS